jgi:hypothetical protein
MNLHWSLGSYHLLIRFEEVVNSFEVQRMPGVPR